MEHMKVLARKARQLIYTDEFGNVVYDDFNREIERFYFWVVLPEISEDLKT